MTILHVIKRMNFIFQIVRIYGDIDDFTEMSSTEMSSTIDGRKELD